jgi:hypothetical protein
MSAFDQCYSHDIIITTAEASGVDLVRANDIQLSVVLSQKTVHSLPLSTVCVADSVLEARVSEIEKIIAALLDANATAIAQIAAVFGAKRDHVDHRTLPVGVHVQRGELYGVRLDVYETSQTAGPYRSAALPPETINVDLFGIDSRDVK